MSCQDIDAARRHTQLIGDAFTREVFGGDFLQWGAERFEGAYHTCGVFGRRVDPDVEIAGGTRPAMERQRVCADDQKAHLSLDERAQQIDKVGVHLADRHVAARGRG